MVAKSTNNLKIPTDSIYSFILIRVTKVRITKK